METVKQGSKSAEIRVLYGVDHYQKQYFAEKSQAKSPKK